MSAPGTSAACGRGGGQVAAWGARGCRGTPPGARAVPARRALRARPATLAWVGLVGLVMAGLPAVPTRAEDEPAERPAATGPAGAAEPGTRATMREIFEAVTHAFVLSLGEPPFGEGAAHEEARAALAALAVHADRLGAHSSTLTPSYDFLRRSLATDIEDARINFERGQLEGARFLLHQLIENCFACHSRLPAGPGLDLGEAFLARPEVEALPLEVQARLAVASREFESALVLYETLLASASTRPVAIDQMGAFENYLKVAIRVRDDLERPSRTLERFRRREDVPVYLDRHIASWTAALRELGRKEPAAEPSDRLAAGRALVREAQLRSFFPADPRGLVYFVAASSELLRFVESAPTDARRLAEAYYLLGVSESHVTHSPWLSETEFFLERAIRTDPRSAFARDAYAFLEEYLIQGFTGPGTGELPADIEAYLAELRGLLAGEAAAIPSPIPSPTSPATAGEWASLPARP